MPKNMPMKRLRGVDFNALVIAEVITDAPPPPRVAPRSRGAGRPAARRSASRGGDSGDDDPEPAPPAAREAVARTYEAILRRRHPGTSWEVRR